MGAIKSFMIGLGFVASLASIVGALFLIGFLFVFIAPLIMVILLPLVMAGAGILLIIAIIICIGVIGHHVAKWF